MGKIFMIVGPSGSGKTTLGSNLAAIGIPELVSHTTREMREGERDGAAYHFVTEAQFKKVDKVEESTYSGKHYGLSRKEVSDKMREFENVFIVTDIHGMRQIKQQYAEQAVSIFIEVKFDEMVGRMKARGDSDESIAKRVSNAILNKELENDKFCNYVIRNDNFTVARENLLSIVRKEIGKEPHFLTLLKRTYASSILA